MQESQILKQLGAIKKASRDLRVLPSLRKNRALRKAALLLQKNQADLLRANEKDLARVRKGTFGKEIITPAFLDRLTLTPARIAGMVESLNQVASLADPVGELVEERILKNGLRVRRVRAPLGVIFMIFESRPNVAIEAFSLAFKSGNAMILRGGKESSNTCRTLYGFLEEALISQKISKEVLWGIEDPDRAIPNFLLKQKAWIDVVVPRGGSGLIDFVTENSKIPVIKNDRGLCHVYVHEDADPDMAIRVILNAKTQRPGVCNAMETLLVHSKIAKKVLPQLHALMLPLGVTWFACPATLKILKEKDHVYRAGESNWDTEYLDLKLNSRVVYSLEEALEHIEAHGSKHSECIITRSEKTARIFQREVDAAAVYWNASTRFTDGFELGLGGELGISTQKLHARGPVGLRELTSARWILDGQGQIRK